MIVCAAAEADAICSISGILCSRRTFAATATDLGQVTAPYPDEGLATFAGNMLDNGFSEREVRKMVRDNAAQLLGARTAAAAHAS